MNTVRQALGRHQLAEGRLSWHETLLHLPQACSMAVRRSRWHVAWQRLTAVIPACLQEQDLIRLKREAKAKNGFYVEPEAKMAFVIRIRGINDMHPKVSCRRQ